MSVLALRRAAPAPASSPQRAKLAETIATRDAAAVRLTALSGWEKAEGRAAQAVHAAEAAHDAAQQAVDQARSADAKAATAALIDDAAPPRATRPVARLALQDAEDALAAAEAARDSIGAEIAELGARAAMRDQNVRDAVEAVLRAEMADTVAALSAELADLHRRMVDRGRALYWLVNANVVREWGEGATPGIGELSTRNASPPESWALWRAPGIAQTALAWDAALAALMVDATAPVPTLQP